MIVSMREIGKYLDTEEDLQTVEKVLTLHQAIDKVIVLHIKKDDVWAYQGASVVDYDLEKAPQFLYRQGPPNGPGQTPAALITEVEKTFPKKMLAWFKRVPKWGKGKLSSDEIAYIKSIGEELKQQEERIIEDVNTILKTIDRSAGNTLLTLEIDNGTKNYIGDSEPFVKLFLELVKEKYYTKYGTTSRGEGICYVCNNEKNVFGFVTDVFSFYTLDKRGFAPGLDVSEGWKSFPVCFECALLLEISKKYLDENLLFQFYGAKYYLIPRTVSGSQESLDEVLTVLREQEKDVSMAEKSGRLTDDEEEILEEVTEMSDSVLLNFLFFITEQSSMRILGYMEDVLPSRISRIFQLKHQLENHGLYIESSVQFNFSILRNILALGRDAKDFKEFIHVTGRILKGQDIDRGFLLDRVLTLLENQRNEHGLHSLMGSKTAKAKRKRMDSVLRSMMLIEFIDKPDEVGDKKMSETQVTTREDIVEEIFNNHPSFFQTHSQRVAFLIGLLTGRLMAIQGHERGSAPFEKKLHNLRFSMKRLQRLYVQVEMKLKAYGYSGSYRDLEQMLAEEIMSAASEDVDQDELSLSFVIGLNQSYKIKSKKGADEE